MKTQLGQSEEHDLLSIPEPSDASTVTVSHGYLSELEDRLDQASQDIGKLTEIVGRLNAARIQQDKTIQGLIDNSMKLCDMMRRIAESS